mgnify:CR=1 FL=1
MKLFITISKLTTCFVVFLLTVSCATLQQIIPFKELDPKNLEPRVSFIEKNALKTNSREIKATKINQVEAEKVIASYQRLLNRGDAEIRMEALYQLAHLSMQLAESNLVAEPEDNPSEKTNTENGTFNQAINYYQTLIKEFPNYGDKDKVKYQLARAHSLNADPQSSLKLLDQIAELPVKSNSFIETQFRRGESYFIKQQFDVAQQAYSQVMKEGKNTEFYEKALYKRGWSLFKQSLYPESQRDFFELYQTIISKQKISQQAKTNSSNGDNEVSIDMRLLANLLDDTRRVISLAFYNQDGVESVNLYFDKHGRQSFEHEIYQSLAELYINQERFQDAADTYMGFIKQNPLSTHSPKFHADVIEIYRKGGFPSLILPAKESFVINYGRQSQFWKKFNNSDTTKNSEVIDSLKPTLEKHLKDISTYYHAQAQQSKKAKDYLVAANWYKEILATFDAPKTDSKFRFLMAETLSNAGELQQAANEYETVAYKNIKSQYSRDAGYRALVAYQQINYSKSTTLLEKLLPSILSGLKFSDNFPDDLRTPDILARVSEQQLNIDDIDAAIQSSNKLLESGSKASLKQKHRARIIVANGLFDLKRYAQAEATIGELLGFKILTSKQTQQFKQRRVEAVYKLAELAKAENKTEQAILLFQRVMDLEPQSKVAINAHFDAATLLLQTKAWSKAEQLFVSFRQSYPKHQLTDSIDEKLALIYQSQENWGKAAEEYKRLAVKQNDNNLAREGYWQVAELYMKAGDKTKSIAAYKHYVWTYPAPYLLAQEARAQLVKLYIETNDPAKTYFWRQKIVNFYNTNQSQNNTRTAFLAAESKYLISQPLFDKYQKIKLRLPLAKTLKQKRKAMKIALKAYNDIAGYNVAQFTTASTHKVARIYQILSDDLMSSQRPKGLDEEELEEYGYLLEDQALPFEDKAIAFFETNAHRTVDNIYDGSVKDSINSLKKLKPAQFDKSEILEELESVRF